MEERAENKSSLTVKELSFAALFAVIITLCSWITIPMTVPFTMQTFAVFCGLGMLGGKLGTIAVLVYIALGAVGLPVFSGFKGGFGVLLGTTGGYIVGLLLAAALYWLITKILGDKLWVMVMAMVVGLAVCYAFGTAWYMIVYGANTGPIGILTALGWCVFPFIIPDIIKIGLAIGLTKKLKKYIKL